MKIIRHLSIITLSFSLCSCGDKKKEADQSEANAVKAQTKITHESVREQFVSHLEEMSEILATIKDLESARSAIPSLTKLGYKLKMIQTDMEKLGPADHQMASKLEKEYGSRRKEAITKISQSMNSLKTSNPEAYDVIDKVMKTILE